MHRAPCSTRCRQRPGPGRPLQSSPKLGDGAALSLRLWGEASGSSLSALKGWGPEGTPPGQQALGPRPPQAVQLCRVWPLLRAAPQHLNLSLSSGNRTGPFCLGLVP